MITLDEVMKIVPKVEKIEIHAIERSDQYDVIIADASDQDVNHPWHEYSVMHLYSNYDRDIKDSYIHLLVNWEGEDVKNN